jgi:NADH:ubiquinone oxidoreductase subunit 6 (subunit J)
LITLSDIFFYILSSLVVLSAYFIAFGKRTINFFYSFLIFFVSVSGIFALLNFELFALMRILAVLFAVILFLLIKPGFKFPEIGTENETKHYIISFLALAAILTALTASLVSSANWNITPINYDVNTLGMIFSKYLLLVIISVIGISVSIFSITHLFRVAEDDSRN